MSETIASHTNFFVVGGTLGGNAASYIRRPLDDDLLRLTLAGEYCNVLAARQMGKSSLIVRTSQKLREYGARAVIIDITSIGSSVSPSEWYFGLLSRLARELKLDIDEHAWWRSMELKSPVHRFRDFLRDVILEKVKEPIVVFIDEIDSTLKLDFTDDFFAVIREAYNARSGDEAYKRLTFVLLGVARPGDLIKDRTRTPYNIGINVDVTDFRENELDSFRAVLDEYFPKLGKDILNWVLKWTGGQPYLTQKLCAGIVEQNGKVFSEEDIAGLVDRLFLGDQARTESNLRSIRDRISSSPYLMDMLSVYKRVLAGKKVVAEERSIAQNELKLTGLVRVSPQGDLETRNRIYGQIFNQDWVRNSIPANVKNRRLITAISSVAVLAVAVAGFFYYRQVNQAIEIQAQTYVDGFNTSTSQEVRITNLAGLFGLGGEYETQARELFLSLPHEEQLALFDLATPENVGNELVVVINGVYQSVKNTAEGNILLSVMSTALEGTAASGSVGLVLEINDWLAGREAASRKEYSLAISMYTRAYEDSQDRKNENAAILIERASVYAILEQYAEALVDYDTAVGINAGKANEVKSAILGNQKLAKYWQDNLSSYPNLLRLIASSTESQLPTITPTLAPTPIGGGAGKIAFTSDRDGYAEIYVVNTDGSGLTKLANDITPKFHPSWSPDGKQIAFGSNNDDIASIYIMNADGSNPTKLIDTTEISLYDPANPELRFDEECCSVTWSPDSGKIILRITHYIGCCAQHGNNYIIDVDGGNLIHVSAYESFADAVWSPDSKKILFEGNCSEPAICVMDADGTNLTMLMQKNKAAGPVWSPDGNKIAFSTDWGGNSQIYVMNADGSELVSISYTVSPWDHRPVWSPDSKKIAFLSYRDGYYKIYTINADGTGLASLTNNPVDEAEQVWSPDGTKIAFASSQDGNSGIFMIDSDGTNLIRLTNSNANDHSLAWSP